jgi:hypothetical protein
VTASRRDGRGKKEGGIMAASTAPVTVKETIQVRVAIESIDCLEARLLLKRDLARVGTR